MAAAATAEVFNEDEILEGPVVDDLPAAANKIINRHTA